MLDVLYTEHSPILEISTDEGPVYVNSSQTGMTEAWYDEIQKSCIDRLLERYTTVLSDWKKESVVKISNRSIILVE